MNVHRNYEIFIDIKKYECLKDQQDYLEKIFESIMAIDFFSLSSIDSSEVSNEKQLLYYEALKEIL
jgi:hypothetical protein